MQLPNTPDAEALLGLIPASCLPVGSRPRLRRHGRALLLLLLLPLPLHRLLLLPLLLPLLPRRLRRARPELPAAPLRPAAHERLATLDTPQAGRSL